MTPAERIKARKARALARRAAYDASYDPLATRAQRRRARAKLALLSRYDEALDGPRPAVAAVAEKAKRDAADKAARNRGDVR